ncbi:hypothetical protein [Pseudonocardia sp. WMMC193]|uniref:hypothetical protein n=1 Tax=Pseudonocardia sp. WMMC193 TaxID=2911965 RepID=UPI001F2A5CB3|nr:hypothetical protein [Pseudonocardia sp. WMMC193]MCF7553366.1 hypothetical protein [Pseudonocardia sp. WMMC193]
MSRFTRTARIVAVSALGVPLTLAGTGVAQACETHHDSGPGRQTAVQGGSLVGLLGQVNPALNVGGVLSKGSVDQKAYSASSANSGVQQSGGHGSGRRTAVQGGDLVGALLQVNPAANVGGIGNSGPVHQNAYSASSANSGVQQSGGSGHGHGGHGGHDASGGQESFQAGDLVSGLVQVNPAVNAGGILNSGDVTQTAYSNSSANSGVQQSGSGGHGGGHGGGHRGGSQKAAQGGSLLGLNLQVNPTVNIGGILSSGDVHQSAASTGSSNSGVQQS